MATKKRKQWDKQNMENAIKAKLNNEMGYLKAAKVFNVPKATLEYYCKLENPVEAVNKSTLGRKPVLPEALETELVNHCLEMEKRFYGLTSSDIRRLAYQLALANNIPHPFSKGKAVAGKKWLRNFLRRNKKLSFRTPQGVSAARIKGFTKENLTQFLDILEPQLVKIKSNPCRIYNVDETGITAVQHKHTKVIGLKGKKQVGALTTAERGSLITVVLCMNANGHYVPPMMIFPRKNFKAELMDGAPPGSVGKCHPSGWIQSYLFTQWMDHFITHVKPSLEDPVILILDGHYTHTRNMDVIVKARENHIILICLPPHSTHKIQPLDVAFMGPLKTYYCKEIETWLKANPGRTVSPYQIASLFGKAYSRAASMEISINGFRKCGIMPFNRETFRDHDFAIHEKLETSFEDEPVKQEHFVGNMENEITDVKKIPKTPQNKIIVLQNISINGCSSNAAVAEKVQTNFIKPADLKPLPVLPGPSGIKRKNAGAAALVSGSPYKDALEEAQSPKINARKAKKVTKNLNLGSDSKLQVKGKTISKKKKMPVSSDSSSESEDDVPYVNSEDDMDPEEEDVDCLFCLGPFSFDQSGERWIQCSHCYRWAHEECAGAKGKKQYLCDLCIDG